MIIEIDQTYHQWSELLEIAKRIDTYKPEWLTEEKDYFISSHILAKIINGNILGFIRFAVHQLGVDEGGPPIIFDGKILIEAKVLSFGVKEANRNKGIGRALQIETMKLAKKLDCYQLRSKSACPARANYHLKISMGFSIQPHHKSETVYFIKAL